MRRICVLAALVALCGCESEGSGVGISREEIDCAAAEVPTYAELQTGALTRCIGCHGSGRKEAGFRYDSFEAASQGADKGADEVEEGAMPDDGPMSEEDARSFLTWAKCGKPK